MTALSLHSLASLLPDRALSVVAATQTPTADPSGDPSGSATPDPSRSPVSVEDVQRSVEESASSGLEFLTGTGLRVAVIIVVAIVLTFVARRLIHRFARSIAEGHTKRGAAKGETRQSGAADAAARTRRVQRSATVGSLLQIGRAHV